MVSEIFHPALLYSLFASRSFYQEAEYTMSQSKCLPYGFLFRQQCKYIMSWFFFILAIITPISDLSPEVPNTVELHIDTGKMDSLGTGNKRILAYQDQTQIRELASESEKNHPIYEDIRKASQSVPRYLFRAWCSFSGGNAELNTVEQITPNAFYKRTAPDSIFNIAPQMFDQSIAGHLGGGPTRSYFSSWSDSIAFVMSVAVGTPNAHVAVVDTTRLPARNNIHWCGDRSLPRLGGLFQYPEEYQIFGVISGEAYKAVPCQPLLQSLGEDMEAFLSYAGVPMAFPIEGIVEWAKLYGKDYELIVAVFVISINKNISQDTKILDTLKAELHIPENLFQNPAILESASKNYFGWTESDRALEALQVLTDRAASGQSGRVVEEKEEGEPAATSLTADDEPEVVADKGPARGTAATSATAPAKHVPKSARMTREQHALYIDMVGYQDHNKEIGA